MTTAGTGEAAYETGCRIGATTAGTGATTGVTTAGTGEAAYETGCETGGGRRQESASRLLRRPLGTPDNAGGWRAARTGVHGRHLTCGRTA